MREIDTRLMDALFYPAIKADFFNISSLEWKDPKSRYQGWEFLKDLKTLSEFYQEINPVLSAALWGVWNATRYFRAPPSLLGALFPWQPKQRRLFLDAKALTATAVVQFADGNAYTISTGNVLNNGESFDKYLIAVESAIQHLQKINDESG